MRITVPDDCHKLQDAALAALVRFKLQQAKEAADKAAEAKKQDK